MFKKTLYLAGIIIINYSLFITHCHAQWVQYSIPATGNVFNMQFINGNTGFLTLYNPINFLKTTNGGINWNPYIINPSATYLYGIDFLNDSVGYAADYTESGTKLYKTTNGGINWEFKIQHPFEWGNITFVNENTGWTYGFALPDTYILRTTDGGNSTQQICMFPGSDPRKIKFLPQKYNNEYVGYFIKSINLYRTTNSGLNWTAYSNIGSGRIESFHFLNRDTGWVVRVLGSSSFIHRTYDGGLKWVQQSMTGYTDKIFFADVNHGWGIKGEFKIHATSNSGNVWGLQDIPTYLNLDVFAVNKDTVYSIGAPFGQIDSIRLLKTTNGGGVINSIQQINSIAEDYQLYQNYPNPFNPTTKISFSVKSQRSKVKIVVYDILSNVISELVNKELNAGKYEIEFNAHNLSSGVYFYKLIAEENNSIFIDTKKMLLLK